MAPTSSSDSTSNDGYKFHVGQLVWCLWIGRYYKARIVQKVVRYTNFQRYYMVHFIKFSRSWDSGVAESRLLSCTKENNISVKKSNLKLWREIKEKRKMDQEKLKLMIELEKPLSEQRQLRVDLCRLNYPMTRDTLVYGDKRNRQLLAEAKKKIEDKTSASKNTVENNESANKNNKLLKCTLEKELKPIQGSENKDDQEYQEGPTTSTSSNLNLTEKGLINSPEKISSRLRSKTDKTIQKGNKKLQINSSKVKITPVFDNEKLDDNQLENTKRENVKKSSLQHFEKGKKNFQDVNLSFDKEDIVGSFQKANSSNDNPSEIKMNSVTLPPPIKKIKTIESSNMENINNQNSDINKGGDSQNFKKHKRHKKRRTFQDINLYLDDDDVIVGSHRLACGEYKYPTFNEINQNENIVRAEATSEIMNTEIKSSNESHISNVEYEEATTSNKEDNLQMRDKQQNSNNSNDNKLKSNNFEKVATTSKTVEYSKLNQPDSIKMDCFVSATSSCEVQKILKVKKYNPLDTSLFSIAEESCPEINSNSEKFATEEKNHSYAEVTTSESQMKLNDHEVNVVNPKDGFLIDDSILINRVDEEVSTSVFEKLMVFDAESQERSCCIVDATTKQTESFQTEIINTNLATEESFLENNLEKERTSLNENDHYDIEVTTSEPVELILNNPEDFINANDCCVIHESSESRHKKNKENDKYLADEVTTSMSEQQFMLPIINDKNSENIPVDEISSCVYNTSNAKKNYSSETNEHSVTEDFYPIEKQDERYSTNVNSNQNDVEVTTTKSEEHLQMNIQQVFANFKDNSDSDESIEEVHSNSHLKISNPSNTSVLIMTTDKLHSESNITDERHSTNVENDNFEDNETISEPEEQFNFDNRPDFIKTDSSVNDESSYEAHENSNFKECNSSTKKIITGTEESYSDTFIDEEIHSTDDVLIDNFNEVVTTSISEEQLILDNENVFIDSRNTSVCDKPICEDDNLNLMKCNSSETTIEERITYLEDERCSVEVENNYFEEEVTTSSKPEEHSTIETQLDFNNSKNCSMGGSNDDKSCCVINKILSFYNNGPCRISRFSIVAAVSDLKKNLDSNERDTINGKKFDDCEKICTKNMTNRPTFSFKVENMDPENNVFNRSEKDVPVKLENETGEYPFIISENNFVGKNQLHKSVNSGIACSSSSVGVKNKKTCEIEGNYHIEKVKARSSSSKKKTNYKEKNTKGDDSKPKSKAHKKHKKNKSKNVNLSLGNLDIPVADNQFTLNHDFHVEKKKISSSATESSKKKKENDHAKKLKVNQESKASKDILSNNNFIKKKNSKISSNTSSTNMESKYKKFHDHKNESLNTKAYKEHEKNNLIDVDIYSIEDNVVGNYHADPASNDYQHLKKKKYIEEVNSSSTNAITKKEKFNDIKNRCFGNNYTKKSKHKKPKLKEFDIYHHKNDIVIENHELDFPTSSNCNVNKKNNSEIPNSSSSTIVVPENIACYDLENEILNVKKVKEHKIQKKKKPVDEEMYSVEENIVLNDHVNQVEDVNVTYKKTSKYVDKCLEKDVNNYQLLSQPNSHQSVIENWSCESASSSTHFFRMESDDDNDGQTTDDDDQYVKNRKVTKKKRKLDDEDRIIFEQFGCEKPYSRAAKVKATEAISSQMKKPPTGKEKKNDGKRSKNGRKKDDEDPFFIPPDLSKYNLNVPIFLQQMLIEDKHLIEDDRFMAVLPARLTVCTILHDYASKYDVCPDTLGEFLVAFNLSVNLWLLHPLERPKFQEMREKHPEITQDKIYGLPHLLRFIMKLPKLFCVWGNILHSFVPNIIKFTQGLLDYLTKENIVMTQADYDCIMPDYYRMAYYS